MLADPAGGYINASVADGDDESYRRHETVTDGLAARRGAAPGGRAAA
jgi:hypothetical protein